MTLRRLFAALLVGTAALGAAAPTAVATTTVQASGGRAACAWAFDEGVCISNPLDDLPVEVPKTPKLP